MSIGQLKVNAIRLVGGVAVLDYLNTCDGRRSGSELGEVVDKLSNLEDIVHWFHHAGLIQSTEHPQLVQLVQSASWHSVTAFTQLIAFRETLYRIFLPLALGQPADPASLEELNAALVQTSAQRRVVPMPGGFVWRWLPCHSLDDMTAGFIGRLAVQAAALLTSDDLARLKACATPNCDWLFIDTSKTADAAGVR
jgi:predicted RNA-binding Zn ribbon-like protein